MQAHEMKGHSVKSTILASAALALTGALALHGCQLSGDDETWTESSAPYDAGLGGIPYTPEGGTPARADAWIEPDAPDAGPPPDAAVQGPECPYTNDDECDEPELCPPGTDTKDCATAPPQAPLDWTCSDAAWGDSECDCGCGAEDRSCPPGARMSDCENFWCEAPFEPSPDDATACVLPPECVVDNDCGPNEQCLQGTCTPGAPPSCNADATEENDELGGAARFVVPGRLNVNFCDDAEDWYTLALVGGQSYRFDATALQNGGQITFELYGPGGNARLRVGAPDAEGGQSIRGFTPAADGRHYLHVAPADGRAGDGRAYTLTSALDGAAECVVGETRCTASGDRAHRCDNSGRWDAGYACPGCVDGAAGPTCEAAPGFRIVSSRLSYQPRGINPDWTDWGDSFVSPAGSLYVLSYSAAIDDYVDQTFTNDDGSFTIQVPSPSVDGDQVIFLAALVDGEGVPVFAVAEPSVPDGVNSIVLSDAAQANATYQGTFIDSGLLDDVPEDFYLPVESSGWMRVFDYGRYVYNAMQALVGRPGLTMVVWMRQGTSWDCGACQAPRPATVGDSGFDAQLWIPATDQNQSYWSDAVTAHELGHWLMASYSSPASEGGLHLVGARTFPGQAWSEGFATWTSSVVRGSGVYYDKQAGSFFWIDLDARNGRQDAVLPPDPADTVYQRMDENEVAAELWAMSVATRDDAASPPGLNNGHAPFIRALTSPQMLGPEFGWGYTRHVWEIDGRDIVNVQDTGEPAACFADYLDALRCYDAVPAAVMVDALNGFPYDPFAPYCP